MTETDVRILTESLGGSPLALLAQRDEAPAEWYAPRPAAMDAWISHTERTRRPAKKGWWDALSEACVPRGVARERITRVVAEGGVVVTSGQQPGLFGGPIYTFSKALSALALADAIEAASGVPAAPVFWAATDDTDFHEASWTMVAKPGGAERLALSSRATAWLPLAETPLADVAPLLDALERSCGSAIDRRPIDAARRAYRTGATLGLAYVELLRDLLEPLGVVVLDASHPAIGAASHDVLARALERHAAIESALAERATALRSAGFEPQVDDLDGRTLVFQRRPGRRERIVGARARDVVAAAAPGTLSPNVLLRPIVERALLPSVAYMAGPGELAYFAQVSAVASAMDIDVPLALPRWSATLVEPHIDALLSKYGLGVADFADAHSVESRFARSAWPASVSRWYDETRGEISGRLADLRSLVQAELPELPPDSLDGVERGIAWRLRRFERRVNAAVKRREERAMRDLATARAALYPGGQRQERALNLIPTLARHGLGLLARMRDHAAEHARSLIGAEVARPAAQ